ncbi:unnamed protein product, partial [marine sediment metagenome]
DAYGLKGLGEAGLDIWSVFLDTDGDGVHDDGEPIRTTTNGGMYNFGNLPAGDYTLVVPRPLGFEVTHPADAVGNSVAVQGLQIGQFRTVDFGVSPPVTVSGQCYNDVDLDGEVEAGEVGVSGLTVYVDQDRNGIRNTHAFNTSTGPPFSIEDFATGSSTITVPTSGTPIADVNVRVAINHPYVGDLEAWVVSPVGTRVLLFSGVGGSGDNFNATFLDDEAASYIADVDSGDAPFTGRYYPEGLLSDF